MLKKRWLIARQKECTNNTNSVPILCLTFSQTVLKMSTQSLFILLNTFIIKENTITKHYVVLFYFENRIQVIIQWNPPPYSIPPPSLMPPSSSIPLFLHPTSFLHPPSFLNPPFPLLPPSSFHLPIPFFNPTRFLISPTSPFLRLPISILFIFLLSFCLHRPVVVYPSLFVYSVTLLLFSPTPAYPPHTSSFPRHSNFPFSNFLSLSIYKTCQAPIPPPSVKNW